jgi:hypothetical protein
MIGEIPSRLFLKLGTKWAGFDGWLANFPDDRIGWLAPVSNIAGEDRRIPASYGELTPCCQSE